MNYLVKDTDYTLAYPTAEYITAGTKQITINGIGNYCGSKTVSYEVTGGPAAGYNVNADWFKGDAALLFEFADGSTQTVSSTTTLTNVVKLTNQSKNYTCYCNGYVVCIGISQTYTLTCDITSITWEPE